MGQVWELLHACRNSSLLVIFINSSTLRHLTTICPFFAGPSDDRRMFKDFDYISPEMSACTETTSAKQPTVENEEPTTKLPEEMQDLRIRVFGP